ncbi:MAG: hypothetical protein JST11_30475 [Acidobacteria bacterium]|nr:hypothetical protein [Acidobacteriota bacterium]
MIDILAGAGFTVGVSLALGSLLLRALRIRLHRFETALFAFIAGSGLLSLLVTLLCLTGTARKGVFLWTGAAAIAAAVWRGHANRIRRRTLPALPLDWLVPVALLLTALFIYYFFNAMAPEVSPDGSGYHLGNVARILRHHGFDWSFHSMYAYLSAGAEMLYLFAFAFGRHSAAAMVHFAFLCALPLLMICYGRRFGLGKASLFAALLMFGSPVVAKDGVSAYNDLVVVTVIYAVFYLLQVWDETQESNILILIGLLSGYAYAVKYTAVLTLPFAWAWLKWRHRLNWSAFAQVTIPALVLIAPWVLRNWIWLGNPVAPFANAWFPNPFYHPGMERIYVDTLKHYQGIKHWWQIPLELTLRGGLVGGVFNPALLMLPLSLLALRVTQGRRLLLTALVFAAPAWMNTGSRFLIPAAPFAATALGIGLEAIPGALPLVVAFTGLLAWPPVVSAYCDSGTWRIGEFPIDAALRKEQVDHYILKYQPDYGLKRALDLYVSPNEKVFSFAGRPDAYLDRDIVVSYESTLGNLVNDILWAPQAHPPDFRQRFRFLPVDVRAVRVTNNSTSDNFWTVAEMRVFSQEKEVPRAGDWRVSASPNPWEAPLAFDNSYGTRWSTWQAMRPRAHLEIEFPRTTRIDTVVLECEPAWDAKLQVDVRLPSGRWVPLTDSGELEKVGPPEGMRRAAARDVRLLGIRYLLVNEGDFVYEDFNKYARFWGITQLTEVNGTHFYRID